MKVLLSRLNENALGVAAIDCGLLAAAITGAIIALVQGLGVHMLVVFNSMSSALH
jgi:Flp pilus assembly pilin Flp